MLLSWPEETERPDQTARARPAARQSQTDRRQTDRARADRARAQTEPEPPGLGRPGGAVLEREEGQASRSCARVGRPILVAARPSWDPYGFTKEYRRGHGIA